LQTAQAGVKRLPPQPAHAAEASRPLVRKPQHMHQLIWLQVQRRPRLRFFVAGSSRCRGASGHLQTTLKDAFQPRALQACCYALDWAE
jgi:hypothetical protein